MDDEYKIQTKRLVLGRLQASYIPKIVEYAGNRKIAEMTLHIPHPYHEEDAIFWIHLSNEGFRNGDRFTFGIFRIEDNEFIGGMGLRVDQSNHRAELGYWIAEPYWNMGYATEASKAILKFGFEEIGLHKILATHVSENEASGKVMIKSGMVKEGELAEHVYKNGKYYSLFQYRMLNNEYEALKKAGRF